MAQSRLLKGQMSREADIRRRIDALTGGKPPEAMVRSFIQAFTEKLKRDARAREENNRWLAENRKSLQRFRPRAKVKIDPAEAAAVKACKEALTKRAKGMQTKPPKVPAAVPMIKSGSLLVIDLPPYDFAHGSANASNGTWSTICGGSNSSFAAVGKFFLPPPGPLLAEFAVPIIYHYNYLLSTYTSYLTPLDYSRASASGTIGAQVWVSAGTWELLHDVPIPLFDRRVSVRDDVGDSGGSVLQAWTHPIRILFGAFLQPLFFALVAYSQVETFEFHSLGGLAFAQASISAAAPSMEIRLFI